MAEKLTQKTIDSANYPHSGGNRRYVIWDSAIAGLGLRVFPSGSKSFVLSYRQNGRKRLLTLGAYGTLTLKQARDLARAKLVEVDHGGDPVAERRKARRVPTVAELAETFMETHVKTRCKPNTIISYQGALRNYILPRFGSLKVAELTRQQCASMHHDMRKIAGAANLALYVLKAMYRQAEDLEIIPITVNPTRKLKFYKLANRERYLTHDEIARLADAIRQAENEGSNLYAVAALRLIILSGARKNEILAMKWEYINRELGAARLPTSKTGRKSVILSDAAFEVLDSLPREAGNPFVIVGRNGNHLTDIGYLWSRVLEIVGIEDLRIHDLRHVFATEGVSAGLTLAVLGKLLGHTDANMTTKYAHLTEVTSRAAVEAVSNRLGPIASSQPTQRADVGAAGLADLADLLEALTARLRAGDASARSALAGLLA